MQDNEAHEDVGAKRSHTNEHAETERAHTDASGSDRRQSTASHIKEQQQQADEQVAKPPAVTDRDLDRVPVVRAQQEEINNSRRRLAHYEYQGEAHRRAHPILSCLPGNSPEVTNLRTGETEKLREAVDKERGELVRAERKLASLREKPEVQQQARELASYDKPTHRGAKEQLQGLDVEASHNQRRGADRADRTDVEEQQGRGRDSAKQGRSLREREDEQAMER